MPKLGKKEKFYDTLGNNIKQPVYNVVSKSVGYYLHLPNLNETPGGAKIAMDQEINSKLKKVTSDITAQ